MENQHRKISGYRELSQGEIDLMNKVKALGPQIEGVILEVQAHVNAQRNACVTMDMVPVVNDQAELDRLEAATPERFTALAKTDFQTALMYLTRAVAQPTFF